MPPLTFASRRQMTKLYHVRVPHPMTTENSKPKAAAKKDLIVQIVAAQKQAAAAKKAAKGAKLALRRAKQKFKNAKRAAKRFRKAVKALKSEFATLSVKKVRPRRTGRKAAAKSSRAVAAPVSAPPARDKAAPPPTEIPPVPTGNLKPSGGLGRSVAAVAE